LSSACAKVFPHTSDRQRQFLEEESSTKDREAFIVAAGTVFTWCSRRESRTSGKFPFEGGNGEKIEIKFDFGSPRPNGERGRGVRGIAVL
jgi:hypothetical protein